MSRKHLFANLVALALLAISSGAQVTASSAAESEPERHLASPMVLDVPFPRLATMPSRSLVRFPEVTGFWCEDARIVDFAVDRVDWRRETELTFTGKVEVAPSFDRTATIDIALFIDGKKVAATVVPSLDAEEKASTPFRAVLDVGKEAIAQAAAAPGSVKLAVTLTLKDNT